MLIDKGSRVCLEMSVTKTLFIAVKTDRRPFLDSDYFSGIRCNSSARCITSLPTLRAEFSRNSCHMVYIEVIW